MSTETDASIRLDPELRSIVDAGREHFHADLDAMPLEAAMRIARPRISPPAPPPGTRDIMVPGQDDAQLRMRIYTPSAHAGRRPLMLHLHGGGFVGGSIELDDARCRWLADEVDCVIASLDYPLAPEHPFPAAIEGALAAWRWLVHHAAEVGGAGTGIVLSGSSAGGHVAVGLTLLARARGIRMPDFQILTYPVIDPAMASASYRRYAEGAMLTATRMAWYWKTYAGGGTGSEPLWAPLGADLRGLPPAYVITAEYDVLRDEGEAYAARLNAAGVAATVKRHPGMVHGFLTLVPRHPESVAARQASAAALRAAFAGH